MPVVMVAISALLLIFGLALDSANLFRARLALQSAVDAASLAGTGHIAVGGVSNESAIAEGEDIAQRILLKNLEGSGIELHAPATVVQFTNDTAIQRAWMDVYVEGTVDLWLMGALPGLGGFRTVTATAETDINPAHVTLLLDTSDSMSCSAENSNEPFCGCTDDGATCDPARSKIRFLREAANEFLTYFDESRDRISLIAYNTGAKTLVQFADEGFVESDLNDEINALSPIGMTNPCDAFLHAYLNGEAINELDSMSYVVFSDGPPTAARFWFDYQNPSPIHNNGLRNWHNDVVQRVVDGTQVSRYDFYNWAYRHERPSSYTIVPGRLVPAPDHRLAWEPYDFPGPGLPAGCPIDNGHNPDRCPKCSYLNRYYDRPAYGWLCFSSHSSAHHGKAPFFTPDGQRWRTELPVDIEADPDSPDGNPYRWWKMYYDCAIAHSDALRQQGGLLFTIGLGQPAALAGDPYQNAADVYNRKDIFLRRLSFSACGLTDPDFPEVATWGELASDPSLRNGLSLTTTDPEELDVLFRAVAIKIKTQLVR